MNDKMKETNFNIGIIGLGYWGKNVLRVLESIPEKVKIKYLCDVYPSTLESFKDKYICINDYKTILEDSEIDIVFIITPIETHYEIILNSLKALKHVYVEKPLCTNILELTEIRNKSLEVNRKVYCDYTFIHSSKIIKLQKIIQEYGFNNIILLEMNRESFGKTVQSGVIYDLLPHDISILLTLFKGFMNNTDANQVDANQADSNQADSNHLELLDCKKFYHDNDHHLFFKSILNFKINNIHIIINTSSLNENKVRKIKIYFKDKIIEYDDTSDVIRIFHYYLGKSTENNNIIEKRFNTDEIININYNEPLLLSIESFLGLFLGSFLEIQSNTLYNENWKITNIITDIFQKTI